MCTCIDDIGGGEGGTSKCENKGSKLFFMCISTLSPGADPENLHGRWLTGWLPIVNYTGGRGGGWLVNNGGHFLYYIA